MPVVLLGYLGILFQSTRNLSFLNNLPLRPVVKPLIRLLFYVWPLFFITPVISGQLSSAYVLLAVLSTALLLLLKSSDVKLQLSNQYARLFTKTNGVDVARSFVILLLGAASQELFYRYCIINALYSIGWIAVIISSILFVIEHYLHGKEAKFDKKDFLMQFLLSLICGTLYFISGSLVLAIGVHLLYNLPYFIFQILRMNNPDDQTEFEY